MKRLFSRIYNFIANILFHCFCSWRTCKLPAISDNFYENRLLQKIEPVINDEKLSDTEKIETLKNMIENYDPLEY